MDMQARERIQSKRVVIKQVSFLLMGGWAYFARGYRWRAGIEGRMASLRRDFSRRKSDYHGPDGMERWLGLGVIASNLRRIALAS